MVSCRTVSFLSHENLAYYPLKWSGGPNDNVHTQICFLYASEANCWLISFAKTLILYLCMPHFKTTLKN